jgi:hypothetical protein
MNGAVVAIVAVALSLLVNLVALSFLAGRRDRDVAKLQGDTNGLGRKFGRLVAFELRCIAEEIETEKGIAKAKLMHLADVLEPK